MFRLLLNEEKPYDDCMCIELETDEVEEQIEALKTVFEMLKTEKREVILKKQ